MDKGILLFTLREYIREGKNCMQWSEKDNQYQEYLLLHFLNHHKTVLTWIDKKMYIHNRDENITLSSVYLHLKTRLYIAISNGDTTFDIPPMTDISQYIHWMSLLSIFSDTERDMKVSIHLMSKNKIRISKRFLLW